MLVQRFLICSLAALCACTNPSQDRFYRTDGAGIELYSTNGIPADHSARESSWLNEMCRDVPLGAASYANSQDTTGCKLGDLTETEWAGVVQSGFNNIDARCNQYLSWLGRKRDEKIFIDETTVALTGLLSGVLALASPESRALEFIGLALGFGTSTYNTYNNLVMLSLDPTTIQILVRQRRLAYRESMSSKDIQSKPQAVFVLRNYLDICTPEAIRLDVNASARAAALNQPSFPSEQINAQERVVGQISATDQPDSGGSGLNVDTPDPLLAVMEGSNFDRGDLIAAQKSLCIESDGKVGPITKQAILVYEQATYKGVSNQWDNGKIGGPNHGNEFSKIRQLGDCDRSKYKSFVELKTFKIGTAPHGALIKKMRQVFPTETATLTDSSTLADADVRTAIASIRTKLLADGKVTDFGPAFADAITWDFRQALF